MMKYEIPIQSATPNTHEMINNYYFTEESFELICEGSITQNNNTYQSLKIFDNDDFNIEVDGKKRINGSMIDIQNKNIFYIKYGYKVRINEYLYNVSGLPKYGGIVIPSPIIDSVMLKKSRKEKLKRLNKFKK